MGILVRGGMVMAVRVMQTFGVPRATTNPYIVMLKEALDDHDAVDLVLFSWRVALWGRYDAVHVHWADALLDGRSWRTRSLKRVCFALWLARLALRRTPVVRTVHNVAPYQGPALNRALVSAMHRLTTAEIHLTAATRTRAGMSMTLIPHGHYREWFASFPRSAVVPGQLAFVGLVKPYKGVEQLLDAFDSVARPGLTLRITGRSVDANLSAAIHAAAHSSPAIEADLRYVSEAEFVDAVSRCQVVVLPYRHLHNSGAALAALSLGRPILAPDTPTTRALRDEVGGDWVTLFSGDVTAADLEAAIDRTGALTGTPDLSQRGWSATAHSHVSAYRAAVRERRHTRTENGSP